MTNTEIKALRNRTWQYLSPEVAAFAGLTLFQLQQFVAGTFHPSDEQLTALARRMGMMERVS